MSYQGNAPTGPNLGQQQKRPKRWPWIVLSIVLVALLVVGGLVVMINKKKAEIAARPDPVGEGSVVAQQPPPPPKPGSPVPCRKDRPNSTLTCFPEDINPDAVVDGIAAGGWQCLHHGERDSDGSLILEPRQCQGANNVDQPYRLKESIAYETWDYQSGSAVQSFTLNASTSAAAHKGEHATRQDATDALMGFFSRSNPHIWQGKPQLEQEAAAAVEQLKPRCATHEGQSIAGASATTPSGYQIECSSPAGGISVGDVNTYEQQIKVTAK